jgi:hypothetical protein
MVWILRPPGVSSAVANSRRATHQLVRLGLAALELGNSLCQRGIVEPDPLAKRAEDPVGHLRRGGLGVGQAEDRGGTGTAQQEPDDPAGQHMGLAGAGIGGDPGRECRRRREVLAQRGIGNDVMPLSSVIAITSIGVHSGLPFGNPRQMVVFAAEIAGAARDGARQEASVCRIGAGHQLDELIGGLGSQIIRAQKLVAAGFFRIRIDALGKWLPAGQAEIEKPGTGILPTSVKPPLMRA